MAEAIGKLAATDPVGSSIPPSLAFAQTDTIPPSIAPSQSSTTDEIKPGGIKRRKQWAFAAGVMALAALLLLLWNPFAGSNGKPDREEEQVRKPDPKDEPDKDGKPAASLGKDGKPDNPPRKDEPDKPPEKKPLVPVPPRDPPPFKDRLPWQPAELVEVIGDERGRHWGSAEGLVWSGDGRRLARRWFRWHSHLGRRHPPRSGVPQKELDFRDLRPVG